MESIEFLLVIARPDQLLNENKKYFRNIFHNIKSKLQRKFQKIQ